MKINIPPIVQAVDLNEYHESMGDEQVFVWVNPPYKKTAELKRLRLVAMRSWIALSENAGRHGWKLKLSRLLRRVNAPVLKRIQTVRLLAASDALYGWWAEMFSKSEDPDQHMSAAELRELAETEPTFWLWLQQTAFLVMEDWQNEQKKKVNSKRQS
jgi:hypothetical protein